MEYDDIKRDREVCGAPCGKDSKTVCAMPAGHFDRDLSMHSTSPTGDGLKWWSREEGEAACRYDWRGRCLDAEQKLEAVRRETEHHRINLGIAKEVAEHLSRDLAAERAARERDEARSALLRGPITAAEVSEALAKGAVERKLAEHDHAWSSLAADRDHWKARAEALAKVAKFAVHRSGCNADRDIGEWTDRMPACTCGLDAARKDAGL